MENNDCRDTQTREYRTFNKIRKAMHDLNDKNIRIKIEILKNNQIQILEKNSVSQ